MTTVEHVNGAQTDGLPAGRSGSTGEPSQSALDAIDVSAWFGSNKVLERMTLSMAPSKVTALIGPSGCGKSTFLRILNRMHELIPTARVGRIGGARRRRHLRPGRKVTEARRQYRHGVPDARIPFPPMSIYDNVLAGLRLTGTKVANP